MNRTQSPRIRRSAITVLALTLTALYHCNRTPPNEGYVVAIQGSVKVLEKDREIELDGAVLKEKPRLLVPGDFVLTGPRSLAEIRFRNGMLVRVGPDSRYRYAASALIGDLDAFRYRATIEGGTIYFKSESLPPGTEFILQSNLATASVRGTEFIMTANEEYAEILVREGQVDVKAAIGTKTAEVKGGQKALVDRLGNITVSNITDRDQGKFDIMTAKLGDRKIDDAKEFTSDDEIRAHYGTLFEVQLVDERVYNGYIVRNGDQVKIHTTYGVIELDNSMIQNVKELR